MLQIDPRLDPARLASAFAAHGRLHVPGFLSLQGADDLCQALLGDLPWNRAFNWSDRHFDVPLAAFEAQAPDAHAALDQAAIEAARTGFQYRFDSWKVSDTVRAGQVTGSVVEAAYGFLNSPAFLDFVRAVTGDDRIRFCDAQATRYRPGDFLTAHNDHAEGKNRLYAYVLNLTAGWTADWGGLLMFLDQDGHVSEGYTPAYNALNLFRVPQRHAVSYVAPFAGAPRLAITGWIREGQDQ